MKRERSLVHWAAVMSVGLSLAFTVGCGKKEEEEDEWVFADEIVGEWKGTCTEDDDATSGAKFTYTFTDTKVTILTSVYDDTDCDSDSLMVSVRSKMTYTLGEDVAAYEQTKQLNLVLVSSEFKPTAAVATAYNTIEMCGESDWSEDEYIDITGLDCGEEMSVDKGDKSYDIMQILETKAKFGKATTTKDGSTAAKRPAKLDTIKYTKQ